MYVSVKKVSEMAEMRLCACQFRLFSKEVVCVVCVKYIFLFLSSFNALAFRNEHFQNAGQENVLFWSIQPVS